MKKITAYRNLTLRIVLNPQEFNKIDFFAQLVISLVPDEILMLHVFYLLDVKGELQNFDTDKQKRDIYDILLRIYGIDDREYIFALIVDCQRYRLILASKAMQAKKRREGLFLSDLGREFLTYIFEPKEDELNGPEGK